MNKNEALQEVAALSKGITHDAGQLLDLLGTAAWQAPIPGTDKYVVAGTLAMIGAAAGTPKAPASADNPSTAGAAADPVLATWPARIWLQDHPDERQEYPGMSEDVTWCEHGIHAGDVEYVRADLAAPVAQSTAGAAKDGITSLEGLTRYDYVPGESGRMAIGVEDGGAFLSYYDVERLLAAPAAQATTPTAAEVRDQALEEAAKLVESKGERMIASAVRSLSGKNTPMPVRSERTSVLIKTLNSPAHLDAYVRQLAISVWRTHYRDESPKFELLEDTHGVLSQIDNMLTGLVRATRPPRAEPEIEHSPLPWKRQAKSGSNQWRIVDANGRQVADINHYCALAEGNMELLMGAIRALRTASKEGE